MSEDINPMMALVLQMTNTIGHSEEIEENVKPIQEQFDMKPGDKVIVAASSAPIDQDFIVGEILDPETEEHKLLFPNYVTRLKKSRVLLRYFSHRDISEKLGWFSRMKLIGITESNFEECLTWKDAGSFPDEPPEWMHTHYNSYTDKLNAVDPRMVPKQATCPKCGSRDVELHIRRVEEWTSKAGEIIHKHTDKPYYLPLSEQESDLELTAHLHCMNDECNIQGELDMDEWHIHGTEIA